ncbi:MAG: hemolysin family protein [Actinomycetes bacterium]
MLAVLILIVVNGVFVAAEFALVATDRARIDGLADRGVRRARLARLLLRRLSLALAGAQLGITVTSLMLGFLAGPLIARLIEPLLAPVVSSSIVSALAIVLALIIATVLQMVLGELTPKTIAIARPEPTAMILAPFLQIYGIIFGPIIRVLNRAANVAVRLVGVEPRDELESVRSLPELSRLLTASAEGGMIGSSASMLFVRSVRFADKTVADALVPRGRIAALETDASAVELLDLASLTGFSRFPVYRGDLDDIVGVVLVKAVGAVPAHERLKTTVGEIMGDVVVVPETRALYGLLGDMQSSRNHLAIVVDEHGGTAGIITLEDVVEEIVGEIDDEYDPPQSRLTAHGFGAGPWELSGSLHPDEVEERTGFHPPDGDYETLAGFVLDRLGRIPEVGEKCAFGQWTLEVVAMDGLRVATVRIGIDDHGDRS